MARAEGPINQDKLEQRYRQLFDTTSRVVGQARRFSEEIAQGMKRSANALKQLVLEGLRQELDEMTSRVRQVMKQTRARIFRGNTRSEEKLLSLFEPSTEVIRKGKAGKPNEFGKMVKLQEAENQIITDYEVYARRPHDSDLLIAAIETHQALLGRTPRLVAADAAFYSAKNEAAARAKGVKRVCIPNRSTKSLERKREQRKCWFRNGQKWRTGTKAGSAWSSGDTVSIDAAIEVMSASTAGSGSASSPTMSSTSAALSKGAWPPNHSSIATLGKPRRSSPAGFASPSTVDHSAERAILRREVASTYFPS